MRSRQRAGRAGWIVVLCPREEEQRRSDARIRILLDERGGSLKRTLVDRGPVVVIERDGVVRRLLVAQIERAGALCYPSDDLKSALRLLAAEPRVRSVMVDFALADGEMASWVAQIRAERPDVQLIGTGGVGAESELLAEGRLAGAAQALADQRPDRRPRPLIAPGRLARPPGLTSRFRPPRTNDSPTYQPDTRARSRAARGSAIQSG